MDNLNEVLYEIGANLVSDKRKLAHWIRGIQDSFAQFFVISSRLKQEASELHLLKSFMILSLENLKLKVNELMNEKEDMIAMHSSDISVKEHLIQRINE